MRRIALALLFVTLSLLAMRGHADEGRDAAEAAFLAGEYDAVVAALARKADADSCAFSARALLAKAMTGPADPPDALLHAALDKAEEAIAADPRHVEGRLQRAIALSLILRPMSVHEARKTGWGDTARDLAEAVLADDPQNFYAHGFLSVWHVEVVRRGGVVGSMMMGASVRQGRRHYEAAAGLAPDDASVHWQWARALAALNARKYRKEINAALKAAAAAPVDSEMERVMQARAALLGVQMQIDLRAAEALARRML